ncbi:MAG: P-II family nitrogen regulator [Campylobacterales bacterium]|nr:P-II family nitrogen regulator [Campylobacterales bacterium]
MSKQRNITILTDVEQIICIVQKGNADKVVKAAFEAGAHGATINYAQGSGVREKLGALSVAVEAEKEIITMIVSSEQLNRVFDAMYLAGNLDAPGMGFIYATKVEKAATFIPHEVLKKLGLEQES